MVLDSHLKKKDIAPMKIASVGAGGVGGYYGGLLARKEHTVCVLARRSNLAALKEGGLEVRIPGETFTVPVQTSGDMKDFGAVDYAILAVKNYSLAEVAPDVIALAQQG